MSDTHKKEKHTLHRSKSEYSKSGCYKLGAVGRIKQGHGSFICPCCVHMHGGSGNRFSKIKTLSRRIIRRKAKLIVAKEMLYAD